MRKNVFIKKLALCFLCLSMTLGLSACEDKQFKMIVSTLINKGFTADSANNGATLRTSIENKFKKYNEVLEKLINMGLVSSPEAYRTAMETHKNYLIDKLVDKKLIDEDFASNIAWVIDPQYITRLYNDLQIIKVATNMGQLKSGQEVVWNRVYYCSGNIPTEVTDEMNPYLGDTSNNQNDTGYSKMGAGSGYTDYWGRFKEISDNSNVNVDSINNTLDTIDKVCKDLKLSDIPNTGAKDNKGLLDSVLNALVSIITGANKTNTDPNIFVFFEEGSKNLEGYTRLYKGSAIGREFQWRYKDENGVSQYKSNLKELVSGVKRAYIKGTYGIASSSELEDISLTENMGKVSGGFMSSYHYQYAISDDSSVTDSGRERADKGLEKWKAKMENSKYLARALTICLQNSANRGGRHSCARVTFNMEEDNTSTTHDTVEIDYTCTVNIEMITSRMMFLNSEDLFEVIVGNAKKYNGANTEEPDTWQKYRACIEVFLSHGRTLTQFPYVYYSNVNDTNKYVNFNSALEINNMSGIKGMNVCSPDISETDKYNTNINTRKRVFRYPTDIGNYDLDALRTYLQNYNTLDKELQKKIGDDPIYNWTEDVQGDEAYVETENIFRTSDYTGHADNLEYFKVLRSIAFGNSGNSAIHYNPDNEIGNDLIVTIANIPVFAVRLLEFEANADLIHNEAIEREKENGYITINTNKNGSFLLDPRCKIKAIESIDGTTNEVILKDTELLYNFMTGHIYRADPDNLVKPTDGISGSDRDYISKRFTDKQKFKDYFGPNIPGHLTLMAYEPLYWEDVIDGNWFPIGRTLYLDRSNFTMTFRGNANEGNSIYIKDAHKPIGYLGGPSTNTYSKTGAAVYLRNLCGVSESDNNMDFTGKEIERISMFSDDFVEVLSDYTKDNSNSGPSKTITAPKGQITDISNGKTYFLDETPINTDKYLESNGRYIPDTGYYYCLDQMDNGGLKYFLYYFENGYIQDELPNSDKSKYDIDGDTGRLLNRRSGDFIQKTYNDSQDKINQFNIYDELQSYADRLVDIYSRGITVPTMNDDSLYSQSANNLPIDLPIIGSYNSRSDCSSFASTLALKLDELSNFKVDTPNSGHFYTPSAGLVGTMWIGEANNLADTNFKLISNYCSSADIERSLHIGDFLLYPRVSESEPGHIIYIANVESDGITIYHWTKLKAKGGPYKIPFADSDHAYSNGTTTGYCTKIGNALKISIPSVLPGLGNNGAKTYKYLVRMK